VPVACGIVDDGCSGCGEPGSEQPPGWPPPQTVSHPARPGEGDAR
jgi:hypothetical protein